MKKSLKFFALMLSAIMLLGACAPAQPPGGGGAQPAGEIRELRIGSFMSINTLLPWRTTSDGDAYVLQQVYNTLAQMDQYSVFHGNLLESWEVADDNRTWTLRVRDGMHWHRGNDLFGDELVQVTAEDVYFTFNFLLDPENAAVRHSELYATIESIEVLDKLTLQVVTRDIDVLWELRMSQTYVLPQRAFETGWDLATHPIGSGPYKFYEYVVDSHVTLVRNDDFYIEPGLDRVIIQIIPDRTVAAIALQNQEIDIVMAILPMDLAAVAARDFLSVEQFGVGIPRNVTFNARHPLFEDYRMRRALSMAVDFEAATNNIFANEAGVELAFRLYGPISPERPGGDIDRFRALAPPFDPDRAVQEIEALGWSRGADGIFAKDGERLSFTLQVGNNDANRETLAVIISSQLRAIGVDVNVNSVEWATHLDDMSAGVLDVQVGGGWTGFDGPMMIMHSHPTRFSPNNGFADDRVDAYLQQAWRTLDLEQRGEYLTRAAEIFVYKAAWMGGYLEYWQTAFNNRVTGFSGHASVFPPLTSHVRNVSVQ